MFIHCTTHKETAGGPRDVWTFINVKHVIEAVFDVRKDSMTILVDTGRTLVVTGEEAQHALAVLRQYGKA